MRLLSNAPDPGARSSFPLPVRPFVFVVDDDVSVREALEALIRDAGCQPETFASAAEYLARPRTPGPNCLVLEMSLPDLGGFARQQRVATERTDLPIIFITGHGDVPMSVQAMRTGAAEFSMKPLGDEALLGAIRLPIPRSETALDDEAELRGLPERYASLSGCEREVIALVTLVLLNEQVGGDIGISKITVKAHRGRVMGKMQAQSFADLVKMAARLNVPHWPPGTGRHRLPAVFGWLPPVMGERSQCRRQGPDRDQQGGRTQARDESGHQEPRKRDKARARRCRHRRGWHRSQNNLSAFIPAEAVVRVPRSSPEFAPERGRQPRGTGAKRRHPAGRKMSDTKSPPDGCRIATSR
jgi:FixJ family two-component response regulator